MSVNVDWEEINTSYATLSRGITVVYPTRYLYLKARMYTLNYTSDSWDIWRYTTRKRYITIIYFFAICIFRGLVCLHAKQANLRMSIGYQQPVVYYI